ncbi:porin family protein [uncultured Rikenella sp.]|uniref:porin family protein n=1 Tax=uncultured Rikenella sp. TaxID=368003 RepID=UPI002608F39E|nr:porin family protein [uncultured Rikenella sp.]
MKKFVRLLLLFPLACGVATTASAQVKGLGFGPRVGLNFADYMNSPGSTRTGLYAGAFLDYHITHRWGLETGAYYSQLGSTNNVEMGHASRTIHRMEYLSVPFVAKFNFLGGFRAIAGVEGLFKLSAKCVEKDGGPTMTMQNVRSANLAFTLGAGYLFRCGLDITASYSKGFNSAIRHTGETTCPTYFRVAAGWRFIGTNK